MFRVLLINLKEASRSLGFDSYRLADGLLFNALLILKMGSKIETASSHYEEHDFSSASIFPVSEWNKLRHTNFV